MTIQTSAVSGSDIVQDTTVFAGEASAPQKSKDNIFVGYAKQVAKEDYEDEINKLNCELKVLQNELAVLKREPDAVKEYKRVYGNKGVLIGMGTSFAGCLATSFCITNPYIFVGLYLASAAAGYTVGKFSVNKYRESAQKEMAQPAPQELIDAKMREIEEIQNKINDIKSRIDALS